MAIIDVLPFDQSRDAAGLKAIVPDIKQRDDVAALLLTAHDVDLVASITATGRRGVVGKLSANLEGDRLEATAFLVDLPCRGCGIGTALLARAMREIRGDVDYLAFNCIRGSEHVTFLWRSGLSYVQSTEKTRGRLIRLIARRHPDDANEDSMALRLLASRRMMVLDDGWTRFGQVEPID